MKLYLARHGDYLLDTSQSMDVLTEKGRNDIILTANFLKKMNLRVSNILHSGKYRAQQTAELLSEGIACDQPPQSYPGLNPNDDVTAIAHEVAHWNDDVLLVGHLPFMGRLVSLLITGDENKEIVNFQTGVLVCLDQIDRTRWMINWVLTPELL